MCNHACDNTTACSAHASVVSGGQVQFRAGDPRRLAGVIAGPREDTGFDST
ncbi:hypothetical protein RRSWK_06164 [Rhodopirellula sp. SWK7]|nr:hypothetical protein RRSWK_06164 [Rhodopirellula sp. SWK7]